MIDREWRYPRLGLVIGAGITMVVTSAALLLFGELTGSGFGQVPLQVAFVGATVAMFGASGYVSMRVFDA